MTITHNTQMQRVTTTCNINVVSILFCYKHTLLNVILNVAGVGASRMLLLFLMSLKGCQGCSLELLPGKDR